MFKSLLRIAILAIAAVCVYTATPIQVFAVDNCTKSVETECLKSPTVYVCANGTEVPNAQGAAGVCSSSVGAPTDETSCKAKNGAWTPTNGAAPGSCKLPTVDAPAADASVAPPSKAKIPTLEKPDDATACKTKTGEKLTAANCGIVDLLDKAFSLVSGLVILAIVANMIFAGIQYSLAQGDAGASAKARKRIQDGALAFMLYISLYGFIQWLIPGGLF